MFNLFRRSALVCLQMIMINMLLLSISYAEALYEPQRLMEETSALMIKAFMANSDAIKADPEVAHQLINDNLVPKINFPLMSRWVLGKNWRKATAAQQQEFIAEFQTLVVKFYSKALIQFLDKNDLKEDIIQFKPFRGKRQDKYATVRSQVIPPSGAEPVKVNYDLYFGKSGQWQVYDVSIEGISLVTTYRSSFKQIISQKGMDALLAELKDKNSALNASENAPQLTAKGE
ncbi:MAG: ABC transporter substrate-binding protein [gamma proteobacterium symbiont of Bathyaustriella thionipta]|nr:ABC transporter substrate-binding protein [gamma proteobacterium symbiont of Bathyaustriella thionipta]MCU7950936.1 ABC transporter substrate-binding protein [gamma proteobacterium symbiont of Bathyaustriella thionipta]MCU7953166.1 ABC transporter substrate-binding protein [gamma proteobacterium symbiont of Bathyaustriella thionipta]MCU7957427.1 ABC transporter substrate-binding protein [gamma proteobacterium symbiont of Bathyaustriella thionipta]MCU7968923.1 ABC transporter substrate-bindin